MPRPSDSGSPSDPTGSPFRFRIPVSPPSWNKSYRIVRVPHRGGGSHQQLAKTSEAWAYQLVVASETRKARPKGWEVRGQVRLRYWIRLKRAIDADNVMKMTNDGIANGLDCDDKLFLPCVEELSTGHKQPEIEIEVRHHEDNQ